MICKHLLSSQFSETLTEIYGMEDRPKCLQSIVRAYNVLIDLRAGFPIETIEKYRLEPFYTFLWAYITRNKDDKLSEELWNICDKQLSIL